MSSATDVLFLFLPGIRRGGGACKFVYESETGENCIDQKKEYALESDKLVFHS